MATLPGANHQRRRCPRRSDECYPKSVGLIPLSESALIHEGSTVRQDQTKAEVTALNHSLDLNEEI
jgi:hypothetical protein